MTPEVIGRVFNRTDGQDLELGTETPPLVDESGVLAGILAGDASRRP